MMQKTRLFYNKKLSEIKTVIEKDMQEMHREVSFLAKLSQMDDIIGSDIDKRILQMIETKRDVFKIETNISVFNTDNKMIAKAFTCNETNESIIFSHQIYASFDPTLKIGTIVVSLPYRSLEYYFKDMEQLWGITKNGVCVAGRCQNQDRVLIKENIGIDDLVLQMRIAKDVMLQPVASLQRQLIALAFFSFSAFVLLFVFVSRIIAKPIAENDALQKTQIALLETSKHAAETKSRFISQMSHEFRTPLNSIIGFSQFLAQEKLVDSEYEKLPLSIEKAGKHLLETINQILDFAKADTENLRINKSDIDLKKLLLSVAELLESEAKAKSIRLTCKCDEHHSYSDENMLKSIVINLLANAIKFTKKGEVNLTLKADAKSLKISVRDSGIGISKEQSRSLFQPFSRLEGSEDIEGSGLGLALCSAYAKQLDCKLYHVYHDIGSEFILEMQR